MKENGKVEDAGSTLVTRITPLDEDDQNSHKKDPLETCVSLNAALSVNAYCVMKIPNGVHSITVVHFTDSKIPLSCHS
jgi:hypothetical protein